MNWLIGDTGRSFLDVWSVAHLAFWFFIGSCIWPFFKNSTWLWRMVPLTVCVLFAYGWEAFEKYAEVKWPNLWLNPESWQNSLVSDPLTTVIGVVAMLWMLDRWAR